MDLATRRAEYEGRGLDRDELDPDPLVQFRRWLGEAEGLYRDEFTEAIDPS